ncbi:hypothetical protein EZV73_07435 [Acidaminobacter sp. JC074]|uniref:hypothetical protein n=1 Tax=Acidaminobacter sp. JC074 TaxID=2530199 RepID=UPI001F0D1E9A|nr:hypothetical protein [Acidaminobacter sp. JC074]MCH4887397.1 hypothetical protein [Acidaminobacter sp. JC074]
MKDMELVILTPKHIIQKNQENIIETIEYSRDNEDYSDKKLIDTVLSKRLKRKYKLIDRILSNQATLILIAPYTDYVNEKMNIIECLDKGGHQKIVLSSVGPVLSMAIFDEGQVPTIALLKIGYTVFMSFQYQGFIIKSDYIVDYSEKDIKEFMDHSYLLLKENLDDLIVNDVNAEIDYQTWDSTRDIEIITCNFEEDNLSFINNETKNVSLEDVVKLQNLKF